MKTILTGIILASSICIHSQAAEVKQPLTVTAPSSWSIKYDGSKGINFYSLKRSKGGACAFDVYKLPIPGGKEMVTKFVEDLAVGFVAQAKKNAQIQLESEKYKIEEIKGTNFSGKFVVFKVKGGICQCMFAISDGDGIWNGQYTGSLERWTEALEILKSLKTNG